MRAPLVVLFGLLLVPQAIRAGETFPGQNHLSAGLACHRNLDMECARERLEQALSEFSPEQDAHYMEHVREARWLLAQIHLAAEELQPAEKELVALLLLDPGFELPPGDLPPKLIYVFRQAKRSLRSRTKAPPPAAPAPSKTPSPKKPQPQPVAPPSAAPVVAPRQASSRWWFAAEGRLVTLFGKDSDAVSSGPGAALWMGTRSGERLMVQLAWGYAYHPAGDRPALQAMSLEAEGLGEIRMQGFGLRLGGGIGALAMGTRDRYDHWGVLLRGAVLVTWPARGNFGLTLGLRPSLVVTTGGQSFFLPVSLALETRW